MKKTRVNERGVKDSDPLYKGSGSYSPVCYALTFKIPFRIFSRNCEKKSTTRKKKHGAAAGEGGGAVSDVQLKEAYDKRAGIEDTCNY